MFLFYFSRISRFSKFYLRICMHFVNVLKSSKCSFLIFINSFAPIRSIRNIKDHYMSPFGLKMLQNMKNNDFLIGTPLPTASLPTSAHQGPVMLTAKNLQCMRAILSVAHCHGNLLGSSWHIILTVMISF